jgi:diguanylate cyclase (GGDEF)-like protein/PAS domain S-box-containing protein
MSAARLTEFLEGLLEAVWLVDAKSLRIVAVNSQGAALVGIEPALLVGRPVIELTATPEDLYFWEDVAAGLTHSIHSNTLVRCADGVALPVERKVSRNWLSPTEPIYLVGMHDLSGQRRAEEDLELRLSELRATLESTGDGILVTDLQGQTRNYNRRFAEVWNVPQATLDARDTAGIAEHLHTHVSNPVDYQARLDFLLGQPLEEGVDTLRLKDGTTLERMTVPQMSRGRVQGRVFSFRDITHKVAAVSQLRLAAKVFEASPDAIFITDAQLVLVQVNPHCEYLCGRRQNKLIGTSARDLFFDPIQPDFATEVEMALVANGIWSGEVWRKVGEQNVAVELSWVALLDDKGQMCNTIGFFKDLTERLEAQSRIEKLAYRDVLTGLPNRLLLGQRVEHALRLAERSNGLFAILFIDLDRFKNINDSLGHAFGDRVLIEVADRIQQGLREVDTFSRMGGDEFLVFLQDADALGAEAAARRVLEALSQPFLVDEMSFSLGCSIGIALYPADGRTLEELIKCADTAMHRVKERGRGNFRFYQPQMNVDLLSRMKLDHAMRQAMERGLFRLHYQPQVSLDDGHLLGAEALVRWTDAELGNVPPGQFIPLAEESGFIITIGNWVLTEAVRQAAVWQRAGHRVVVSVNVSALQFQQADFVERVAKAVHAASLKPELLELELTESILVQDANDALERLHALAALGVSLSIDDFGTGYSSLAYLKKFPISKLKIDRSFITGLPQDESDRAIVSATIGLARAMKLVVVAEGVETQEQRDYLASLYCDSFQGFLCSPGVPPEEFERLIDPLTAEFSLS